jgi:predicted nucleic acid-binding protein
MTVLLDASVLIDHLRGVTDARRALTSAVDVGERLAASVVVKVEVLAAMQPEEDAATRRLFGVLDWIAVDDDIAERAGYMANRYLRSQPSVDPVAYLIAATVERVGAELWTRNPNHYPMFPQLAAPY